MSRDFYVYLACRFASSTATTLLRASVAWHLFELTRSPLHLGLIGLVQFIPALALTLVGGAVADSFDRRRVINIAQLLLLVAGFILQRAAIAGSASVPLLYAGVFCAAVAGAFEAPARLALLPALVPRERFARAVTLSSTNTALAFASGPAIAGAVIAHGGIRAAYLVYLALVTLAFLGIVLLRSGGEVARKGSVSFAAIAEGLRFVRRQPVVLGCMTLDMFAVVFGGASALLPVFASDILHAGARGYGLLTSSLEVGALLMAIAMMLRSPAVRAGRALLCAVTCFGVATIVFGFSRSFPLSLAAYMVAGAADQVSVVMRSTAVQLSTPDALRGRVSAVNMLFVAASNQLGAAESGFVAQVTSAPFAVVSGGVACLLVVAITAWRLPELRRYQLT